MGNKAKEAFFIVREVNAGDRTFTAIASDIGRDYYGERMTRQLFESFTVHKDSPPDWLVEIEQGYTDFPYLSISHYLSGGGKNIAGTVTKFWEEQGDFLIVGKLADNDLGEAIFKTIEKEIEQEIPFDERTRISISFIDYGHIHEDIGVTWRRAEAPKCQVCDGNIKEGKAYIDGYLVHCAFTKRPANERTKIYMSTGEDVMVKSKKDAEELVGRELAEQLEEEQVTVERSMEEETIVERNEAKTENEAVVDEKSVEREEDKETVEKEVDMPTVSAVVDRFFALMADIAKLPESDFMEFSYRVRGAIGVMRSIYGDKDVAEREQAVEKSVDDSDKKEVVYRQIVAPVKKSVENEEDYFKKLVKQVG